MDFLEYQNLLECERINNNIFSGEEMNKKKIWQLATIGLIKLKEGKTYTVEMFLRYIQDLTKDDKDEYTRR